MDTEQIKSLIERVERAGGPDRELDALIDCLVRGLEPVLLRATIDDVYGEICDPGDTGYGWRSRCTSGLTYARFPEGTRGNRVQGFSARRFTASLDDAMTLVPQHSLFTARTLWDDGKTAGLAVVSRYEVEGERSFWMGEHQSMAATPAIALCAAALKAKIILDAAAQ